MLQSGARQLRTKIFGVMLRSARMRKGISAETAADVLKLTASAILDFETGRQAINLPQLEELAALYGVPCQQLLSSQSSIDKDDHKAAEALALRRRIIGVLLKQARLDHGLPIADLARQTHLSEEQISAFEFGQQDIPLVELEDLAEALSVKLDYFIQGDKTLQPVEVMTPRSDEPSRKTFSAAATLPDDVTAFLDNPANIPYIKLAMLLSNLPVDTLRRVAEELLEITY